MKEYSHGVSIEDRRRPKRSRAIRKHAYTMIAVAIVVSLVIGATALSISSPPGQHEEQKAHISWTTTVVDSIVDVGQYSSLSLDSGGNIEIMYYNATAGNWKIASYHGAGWTTMTPAPTANDDGLWCSLDTNKSDVKMGSGYDATASNLMYGNSIGEYYVVDSFGDVGQYSSISVGQVTDSIAISYYNASSGDLKVAYNKSGKTPWVIYTVDTGGDVGQYTNCIFGYGNDTIIVDYYDVTSGDTKQAWAWDLGGVLGPWQNMAVDTFGDVGKWNSQALTMDGSWYASWYVQSTQDLRFAYWDSFTSIYSQLDPDTVGDVGQHTSVGVNSSRNAFISYYDATNGNLKLAWNESSTWYNVTLDSTGDVGRFTSLSIDSSDAIHISYYDVTNGNLKYIKVLESEFPIPEFSTLVIPIVGLVAIVAVLSVRRNRNEG